MEDKLPCRSFDSAVDNPCWKADTPCSAGTTGELFGLIRLALQYEVPVFVDVIRLQRWSPQGDRRRVRVYDLQHKAGDWMRIGLLPEEGSHYDDWRDFEAVVQVELGDPAIWKTRVRLPETALKVTEV